VKLHIVTLLHHAIAAAKLDHVKLLLQHNASITATSTPNGWCALHFAAHSIKPFEMMSFLLDNYKSELNIDHPTASLKTPLIELCQNYSLETFKLLLQHGANDRPVDKFTTRCFY
jgi:ankyrin repeat protein